jgi:hypothetical protein
VTGGVTPIPPHYHTFSQLICGFSFEDDVTIILFLGVSFVEILLPVLGIRIRIHRTRMFWRLPDPDSDPDQLVRSTDPDPDPDPFLFS